jgi:tetratricopeptide (TPR) repeat protein
MLKLRFKTGILIVLQTGLAAMILGGLAIAQKTEKPLTADDYYKVGLENAKNGKCEEAVKDFSKAIQTNPRNARYYRERGECLIGINNAHALLDFNKAIKLKPEYTEAYLGRGLVYFTEFLTKGNSDQYEQKALNDFNKSIMLDPQCAECYFNRAKFYFWTRETGEKVFGDLDKAIKLSPGNREYLNLRLTFNLAIGEYGKCVTDSNTLLKLNPEDVDALIYRGHSYFALGDYQKAIDDYSLILEIKPIVSAVFLAHRAKAYRAIGKIKEAEADETQVRILTGKQ